MSSPFIKATCGCVVIPLSEPQIDPKASVDCILFKPCDGDSGNWCFSTRKFESYRVFVHAGYKYHETEALPRPLNENETKVVIRSFSALVDIAYKAIEVNNSLHWIGQWKRDIRNDWESDNPAV